MKNKIEKISCWIKEKVDGAGCKGVLFGLSGGLDSAVVATLCSEVFDRERMLGIIMPCGSQKEDEEDAHLIASNLDIKTETFDLGTTFESLTPRFLLPTNNPLSNANLKARLRMATLYCVANELSYLVVGTGNKTEIMVGYGTKYGDGGVDIQPIGDLYKTEVFEMARVLGLPEKIINKAPSAGLWKGQTDEKEMGITYEKLDKILMAFKKYRCYVKPDMSPSTKVTAQMMCVGENIAMEDLIKVEKMILKSQHKREMPPVCIME
jgi:NAD+ synthase